MNYEIKWLVEDAIIYYEITADSDEESLRSIAENAFNMLENSQRQMVHLISKVAPENNMKVSIWKMSEIFGAVTRHAKLGWTITYGRKGDRLTKYMTGVIGQVTGVRIRAVDDLSQALAFLQNYDSTLPTLTTEEATLE